MAPEEQGKEPGGWEDFMRALTDIRDTLKTVATTEVLRLYQEGNDRRHEQGERALAAWVAESKGEHTRLDGKIEALEDKIDERAEADRRGRAGRTLTVSVAALSAVISIAGIIIGAVVR